MSLAAGSKQQRQAVAARLAQGRKGSMHNVATESESNDEEKDSMLV